MGHTHEQTNVRGFEAGRCAARKDKIRHAIPVHYFLDSLVCKANGLFVARIGLRERNSNYVLRETCSLCCTNFAELYSPPHRHCRTQRVLECRLARKARSKNKNHMHGWPFNVGSRRHTRVIRTRNERSSAELFTRES